MNRTIIHWQRENFSSNNHLLYLLFHMYNIHPILVFCCVTLRFFVINVFPQKFEAQYSIGISIYFLLKICWRYILSLIFQSARTKHGFDDDTFYCTFTYKQLKIESSWFLKIEQFAFIIQFYFPSIIYSFIFTICKILHTFFFVPKGKIILLI